MYCETSGHGRGEIGVVGCRVRISHPSRSEIAVALPQKPALSSLTFAVRYYST